MTFLLGGHETTANALAWTAYLLGQHPEAQARMAAEAREVAAGATPSFEELARLSYTDKVMRESLRLYPPAWYFTRRADEDLELAGYRIAKGTTVVMNLWGLHRDPRFYPDPDAFDPDRWTPEFTKNLPQLAYIPFGIGPRRCIGASFAQMETLTVLAGIVQRFHLELASGQTVTPLAATTLRPLWKASKSSCATGSCRPLVCAHVRVRPPMSNLPKLARSRSRTIPYPIGLARRFWARQVG
jgi:cytochrome P450